MKRVLFAVVVAVFLLGACGDDGGDSAGGGDLNAEEQQLVEISTSLQKDSGDDLAVTPEEADCVGNGMVSSIGVEPLSTVDFSAEDVTFALEQGDAEKAAAVMLDCVDVQASFAKSFSEDGDVSAESAECIAEKLDDDVMEPFFTQVFMGNEDEDPPADFTRVITEGMTDCLTDEEFEAVTS